METTEIVENAVNPTETAPDGNVDGGDSEGTVNIYRESEDDGDLAEEAESDVDGYAEYDEETELSELCRISGVEYGSLSEFAGYERYLELKGSGILTAEEAFYAVNRGKKPDLAVEGGAVNNDTRVGYDGSKRHMTASVRKPSSGEVFTRADREELAKWGITATGSELERLWRNAGSCATRK